MEKEHAPILVTGANRSGTTWVGKMLAASRQVTYIHEPLNVERPDGLLACPTPYRFTYIADHNSTDYEPAFRHLLQLKYRVPRDPTAFVSPRQVVRMARHWGRLAIGAVGARRPLVKDPFAVFSAPWFAKTFGSSVVVTVRHPAAVVASRLRMGWTFPLETFLQQDRLMADWLHPLRTRIERAADCDDPLVNAAVLWDVIYHVVDMYAARYPQFIIVRHEDLSADPERGYAALYEALDLDLTSGAHAKIEGSSARARNRPRRSPYSVALDSRQNVARWKQELSKSDIDRIRLLTAETAGRWYNDDAWH